MKHTFDAPREYSIEDLSKFFGASIATIHNWISQERFVDIENVGKNEKIKIPDDAYWISRTGEKILIHEIVAMYYEQVSKREKRGSQASLKLEIRRFEEKYRQNLNEFLADKKTLTSEEQQDANTWQYLSKRIENKNEM